MTRTSIIPSTTSFHLNIPQHYVGKELEVLLLPKIEITEIDGRSDEEEAKRLAHIEQMRMQLFGKNIDHLRIDTTGFKFNRDEANER